jgi:pimeloyl-ACP methyl ester carboxylesterase
MALTVRQSVSSTQDAIYWPGNGPLRGGVVCLHGSEGGFAGWNDLNCALLAANGFAALAHNYTRTTPWLTHPDIDDVPLEGTETALMALREELGPYQCGVGVFGVSRGAEHALLLTQLLAEDGSPALPDAVAVHSPPDEAWPAFIVSDFQTGKPWAGDRRRPSWSWRGKHDRTRPGTLLGLIPLSCPVFIAQGTQDNVWGDKMARRLVARMNEAGLTPEAHFFFR